MTLSPSPAPLEVNKPPENIRPPLSPTGWAWFAALIGWSVLVSFYDLPGGAALTTTDCWVAQTSREMLEAGEWIVPRFSGELRLQKSPGAYWATMLISKLRGAPVDEFSVRAPNAVFCVAIVAVVFWLARRIYGERAAVFAGFVTASSSSARDAS